jgi:hypothetical protein
MAKPILLGVEGQAKKIVAGFDAGQCYEPENERDFLEKLALLSSDPDLYARHQVGCRALADKYDRRSLAREALAVIQDTVRSRRV